MKCIFSGGGTGGHLYPALAIAEQIMKEEPDSRILFMGTKKGLESEVVPKLGYEFVALPSQGMNETDTFLQKMSLNARFGLANVAGVGRALMVVRKFKPDAVVGTGGFASFPGVMAAQLAGYPTYIHEQNAVPGRANSTLARGAKKLFVGFGGTEDVFGYPEKTIFTGNPVRSDFGSVSKAEARERLSIPEDDFVVFAFGGSLGAATINEITMAYLGSMSNKPGRTLLWGTGRRFHEECVDKCVTRGLTTSGNVRIEGYIDNMMDYVASADLLICRAGALSLAELMVAGKPAIIVPIPNSVGNHQYYNAKAVADAGGAFLVEEKNLNIDDVKEKIEYLASNRNALETMGGICKALAPVDAAKRIYEEIRPR